jgi:hypothetical protein
MRLDRNMRILQLVKKEISSKKKPLSFPRPGNGDEG